MVASQSLIRMLEEYINYRKGNWGEREDKYNIANRIYNFAKALYKEMLIFAYASASYGEFERKFVYEVVDELHSAGRKTGVLDIPCPRCLERGEVNFLKIRWKDFYGYSTYGAYCPKGHYRDLSWEWDFSEVFYDYIKLMSKNLDLVKEKAPQVYSIFVSLTFGDEETIKKVIELLSAGVEISLRPDALVYALERLESALGKVAAAGANFVEVVRSELVPAIEAVMNAVHERGKIGWLFWGSAFHLWERKDILKKVLIRVLKKLCGAL